MLHYRPMKAQDVARCVEIVAQNPFLRPRYSGLIPGLQKTWLSLLGRHAFTAVVFEEIVDGNGARFVGAGISAFVSDSFLNDVKEPPLVWIGAEIVRRLCAGNSPVLSDRELAEANTRGGLNLIGWHGVTTVEDAKRPDVLNAVFSSFIELHRGFKIKELLGQADSPEVLQSMHNSGGYFYDPDVRAFVAALPGPPEEVVRRPHLMGSTRELALAGTWLSGSALFSYQPPRFFFSPSEQRLLQTAMQGNTDTELAAELGISPSSVRRCWLSIYGRVAAGAPEVLGEPPGLYSGSNGVRGKGKKNRLLAYLREHPEELRPLSRRRGASLTGSGVT